ncbi:MAG: T9SS type A sorting domain-containing protein [Ignavibacterium album]|uniref:T9SS type A sorting domain-containing protein n=1 Tax=Ignavibacterium album TaxID=591197 RepID=UPI0026EC1D79|nr:T9SS type A sorting domain-containing protein [Ignavibacterium album]MBI5660920.1 T9SS type A sorting domain-containing protein [Ignavibacterium album]
MLNQKTFLLLLFILNSAVLFSQISYQGPATGNVSSGVLVSTNNFPESPVIISEPKPIKDRNTDYPFPEPMILESMNPVFQPTYVEDPFVIGGTNGIGDNTLLLKKFNGIPQTNSIPPDPTIAVGPNHVVACVNSRFSIWNKEGVLLKSIDADAWCSPVLPSPGAFDPQIIYDHYDGRWFMLWDNQNDLTQTAYFLIFVSDDDDPTGDWYGYKLDARTNGNTVTNSWGDYPQIGFDDKAVYINSRQFNFGGGKLYDKIRILKKTELYAANGGPLTWTDLWGITIPASGGIYADVVHPSIHYSTSSYHYFIHAPRSGGNYYSFYRLSNVLTTPVLEGFRITVPFYGGAPNANQLGGGSLLIEVNGSHVKTAPIFRDGYIYFAHSIRNSVYPSYSSVKYVKINADSISVSESAELGADGFWYFYPTLAVDPDGNIAITCSRSGLTEYIGSFYITRRATDPPGLSGAYLLSQGLGNYVKDFGSGRNRWGDYFGIYTDPADPYEFWLFPEHAAATNTWGTTVAKIRLKPFPGIFPFVQSNTIDFGDVEVGFESDTLNVVLANYGDSALIVYSMPDSIGNFHRVSNHTFPITLNTFDSLTINFQFRPTVQADTSQFYTVSNNSSSFTGFVLRGNGYVINPGLDGKFYAVSGLNNNGNFVLLDETNGSGSNIGATNFNDLIDIAINPKTSIAYGLRVPSLLESHIVRINAEAGDSYFHFSVPVPDLYSIAFDTSGTLYGIKRTGEIYTIDIPSGDTFYVSKAQSTLLSFAFDPTNNELYASVRNIVGTIKDRIVKIDLNTGDTTHVGRTGFNVNTVNIEFNDAGDMFGIKGTSSQVTDFFAIDKTTGIGTVIGSVGLQGLTGLARTRGIVSVNDKGAQIPEQFALYQNYPNPFNPSTTIRFSLPVNANVRLQVYNLLGEVVKEIINSNLPAGTHSFIWDADNSRNIKVTSGIYFYRLTADGIDGSKYSEVKKMILLK